MVTMFREFLIRGIEYFREKYGFKLVGYVLMPDHFHGLILSNSRLRISDVVRDIKAYSGREISRVLGDKGGVWESGFTDKEIATETEFENALSTMHEDPVRRYMVQAPEDYPYSSCRYYLHGEDGPVRIDKFAWYSTE
jgi:putative transposase